MLLLQQSKPLIRPAKAGAKGDVVEGWCIAGMLFTSGANGTSQTVCKVVLRAMTGSTTVSAVDRQSGFIEQAMTELHFGWGQGVVGRYERAGKIPP